MLMFFSVLLLGSSTWKITTTNHKFSSSWTPVYDRGTVASYYFKQKSCLVYRPVTLDELGHTNVERHAVESILS